MSPIFSNISFCCDIVYVEMTVFLPVACNFYNMSTTCCVSHVVLAGYLMLQNITLATKGNCNIVFLLGCILRCDRMDVLFLMRIIVGGMLTMTLTPKRED